MPDDWFLLAPKHWLTDMDVRTLGPFGRGVLVDLLAWYAKDGVGPTEISGPEESGSSERILRFFGTRDLKEMEAAWPQVVRMFDERQEPLNIAAPDQNETGYAAQLRRRQLRLRRARQQGEHTEQEWRELIDEVGGVCVGCGRSPETLTKDHIIPVSQGGDDSIENLQPLCQSCNSAKGNRAINWLATWRAAQ